MHRLLALSVALLVSFSANAGDDFKLEPGFVLLFNGKNLDGWKTRKGGEALDGKTEAYKGRFKVDDGKLIIDPKVRGDVIIDTAKPLVGDVHIKFEFLPGKGCNNDLFIRGLKFDLVKQQVKSIKEGEWNKFEIVIKGKKAEFLCNGQVARSTTVKNASSVLGVRAEFGPVEIRRLRAKMTD
ncbi:MAG: DUF1080 domain-containing protein [Planctomycetes bacterium]|nr:DUF1080 domain-containing protein [Planctomycetota bacterium]